MYVAETSPLVLNCSRLHTELIRLASMVRQRHQRPVTDAEIEEAMTAINPVGGKRAAMQSSSPDESPATLLEPSMPGYWQTDYEDYAEIEQTVALMDFDQLLNDSADTRSQSSTVNALNNRHRPKQPKPRSGK